MSWLYFDRAISFPVAFQFLYSKQHVAIFPVFFIPMFLHMVSFLISLFSFYSYVSIMRFKGEFVNLPYTSFFAEQFKITTILLLIEIKLFLNQVFSK